MKRKRTRRRHRYADATYQLLIHGQRRRRQLDDDELDSGDDEGRNDRAAQHEDDEVEDEDFTMLPVDMPRHPQPEPSDGEVRYSLHCTSSWHLFILLPLVLRSFIHLAMVLTIPTGLPPQSPTLRLHCPRLLLQHRVATTFNRPPLFGGTVLELLCIQNSADNHSMAPLAFQSLRLTIQRPHTPLV
jgi:hypothetical protein